MHLPSIAILAAAFMMIPGAGAAEFNLIPMPKRIVPAEGSVRLTKDSRILVSEPALLPLATILAEEIRLTTGVKLATATTVPNRKRAEILLRLDPKLHGEAYRIEADGSILVTGGNYRAVAAGASTLLQLLKPTDGALIAPRCRIEDEPMYSYRGALLDLARKYHSADGIKQVIDLCRLYKIRYLHLNFSDDQLFMFPSTKFPQLGASNHEFARFEPPSMAKIPPYTLDELRALERYAYDRGVDIVPEMNFPGHSGRLIADAPEIFGFPGNGSTINIASPKTLAAVEILINEMIDVFPRTPYIHLGADEVGLGGLERTPEFEELRKKTGIKNAHDLYCKFIADLNVLVRNRGKQSIVWEEAWNPDGAFPLPKDAIVMSWTHGRNPKDIVASGYQVINASWTPLYIVRDDKRPLEFLYDWEVPMFGQGHLENDNFTTLAPSKGILGAQLCSWENSESIEIQSMRDRLALVAEKTWNLQAAGTLADFKTRLVHTDALLEKLVNPITIQTRGVFAGDENTFTEPITITLTPRIPDLEMKYALDNSMPGPTWKTWSGPLVIDRTVYLRAGLFDAHGVRQGHLVGGWYRSQIPTKPNLATGKPVSVSPPAGDDAGNGQPQLAVDGMADNVDSHWDGGPAPRWLQVDLQNVEAINSIDLVTFWDGARYYQWNAETSVDGKQWTKVLDFSNNTEAANEAGYSGKFPEMKARFVRINMLRNSANPSVHIVELRVNHN